MTLRPPRAAMSWAIDLLVIALIAAALIWPVFGVEYSTRWGSIECTFIADARWLNAHWMHPPWQPLWYTGTRTDYIYPPALRYGTAAIARYAEVSTARAYHIYIAVFYCFGIAGVYFFVRTCSGSRAWAWTAALATALVSPSFAFLPQIRRDAPFLEPQRLGVLLRYGEGPHITSLAWIPVALAFSWRAVRHFRGLDVALAAISLAMVVSTNFYGATALTILFPIAVWAVWVAESNGRIWLRASVIAGLAYGLTAFWLTPSYLSVTLRNMQYVASKGNVWSVWVTFAAVVVFLATAYRFARNRPDRAWPVFVTGSAWLMSINVLGHFWMDFRVIGDPRRLVPELDFTIILLLCALGQFAWNAPVSPRRWIRAAVAAGVVLLFAPAYQYVTQAWRVYAADTNPTVRVEYELQSWMAAHLPDSRAFATGTVRLWYDAWNDLPQLGGGSDQGVLNPAVMPPTWEAIYGFDGQLARMWMQVMGVDAMIVNGRNSREIYHDQQHPEKYVGVLDALYDNGRGDIIYRIPRRWPGLARVVETAGLDRLAPIPGNGTRETLAPYVKLFENGPDAPTTVYWAGPQELRVEAPVGAGQSLIVQVAYDLPWRAWLDNSPLRVSRGPLGFIRIDAPPGARRFRLRYETPVSVIVGRIMTVMTLIVLTVMLWRSPRRLTTFPG